MYLGDFEYFNVPEAMRQKAGPVSIVSTESCYTIGQLAKIDMYRNKATRQISMELVRQPLLSCPFARSPTF